MLRRLEIRGLALIEKLEIELSSGFNVLTGETGAGKSILIRSLHFLSGAKAEVDWIRREEDEAWVMGEFWIDAKSSLRPRLESLGIFLDETNSLLVRRSLTRKGRSNAWINDTCVSLGVLKELGTELVDIFAQHENQKLLEVHRHSQYLDQFLENTQASHKAQEAWKELQSRWAKLKDLLGEFRRSEETKDYLEYRWKELKEFNPSAEDFVALKESCDSQEKKASFREDISSFLGHLSSGADEGVWEVLRRAARFAEKKAGPWKEKEWASQLMRASEEIEQVYFEGEQWLSSLEVNTDDLAHAQERLYDYQQLFRKLSVAGVEGLMEKYATLERDIDRLETLEKEVRDQVRACVEGAEALLKADLVLGAQRRESAQRLKGIVEKELKELAIPNAVFGTEFVPAKRTLSELPLFPPALEADGRLLTTRIEACLGSGERVQFLLSSNPGELPLPLNKVASGGELSRVMLALKKTLATEAETCVLVFDEIDTGISGKVADGVGRKLRDLSRQHQVICISHLPQVAVYADEHFLVRKAVQERAVGGKTALRSETQIVRLTEDEIVGEIARLLSGEEISDQSRANARDLRNHARGGIVESSRNLTRYERKKTPTANKKTPKRNVERHR